MKGRVLTWYGGKEYLDQVSDGDQLQEVQLCCI